VTAADRGGGADLAVVGAGILGLAVAREALLRHEGLRVRIFEKERGIAMHQTGHNSGVVHAGVYYAPGSLKARLCVQGSREIYAYCDEKGIPYERCGKVVVATCDEELPRLEELERRAQANDVPGLKLLDREALADVEPNVAGVRALYSPSTGIVDFRLIARALARDVGDLGGEIVTGANVIGIRAGRVAQLRTSAGRCEAQTVITCAGAYADRLAQMTGAPDAPKIVPFRGRYYSLRPGARRLVRGLVYPVPDPTFPFLGVHFTKQISGDVWTGPNAALAFSREGYRWRDVSTNDLWETVAYGGFRKLATKYWRTGLSELHGDVSKRSFTRSLQRLVPDVRPDDLTESHSGVRAQALTADGSLLDDFWFDHAENVVHVRNAPSPGATSSLALAREIVQVAEPSIASG
jgi:L-2-hydroxyglutarate oxidase